MSSHLLHGTALLILCPFPQGGLKAVVWTDTLQTFLMFGSVIIVMILGTVNVGGPGVVWELSQRSERLEFFK
jgi:Na+/proline symporter